jgi:hypothetical protein
MVISRLLWITPCFSNHCHVVCAFVTVEVRQYARECSSFFNISHRRNMRRLLLLLYPYLQQNYYYYYYCYSPSCSVKMYLFICLFIMCLNKMLCCRCFSTWLQKTPLRMIKLKETSRTEIQWDICQLLFFADVISLDEDIHRYHVDTQNSVIRQEGGCRNKRWGNWTFFWNMATDHLMMGERQFDTAQWSLLRGSESPRRAA